MTEHASQYVHGTTPDEQRRLTRLNELLNRTSLQQLELHGERRVLDVGAGLGQFARAIARAAGPGARVVGVERSPDQIAEAFRQAKADGEEGLIDLRRGEALDLPLAAGEWGTFDLVHARFLLEHLPDPLAAVRVMVRAARPGGRLVLEDDDHDVLRLWPEPPGVMELWRIYMLTYERNGNDPHIGRKLATLMHQAGARPRRNTWIFFGACAGTPEFTSLVENTIGIFRGAREAILTTGVIDTAGFDDGVAALAAWGERPDAAYWFARSWAEGVKPD